MSAPRDRGLPPLRSSTPRSREDPKSTAIRMPHTLLEDLADATATRLPWRPPGPAPTGTAVPAPIVAALEDFGSAAVLVDVEVVVRLSGSRAAIARLRSWQRLAGDRVVAVSAVGPETVELAWFGIDQWRGRLAHAVTVDPPRVGAPPPTRLDVPHELLAGGCAALRAGRPDLVDRLLSRHAGRVHGATATPGLVRRLAASVGRMRTTVVARGARGDRRVGWLSWVLFADGWRALTPCSRGGEPIVRVRAVRPDDLGGRVARIVAGALS